MGFFTDLKEDLALAVDELMPEDTEEVIRTADQQKLQEESVAKEDIQVTADSIELDKMLENLESLDMMSEELEEEDTAQKEETKEMEEPEEPEKEDEEAAVEVEETAEEIAEVVFAPEEEMKSEEEELLAALTQQEENTKSEGVEKKMDTMTDRTVSDETAVITQGMAITGDIISEGSVDLIGVINGNIDILGKLNVTGTIQGNSKASEIYADGAKITGEVVSEGSVKIGQSSVIIGNITATSAVIAGAVKGDIDVQGPVILDTSAIVMGNIKSKSVQINNGAVIEGMCSQCYADVNPTSFFEDLKKTK